MCYKKPGPRCSAHAKQRLQRLQSQWDNATQDKIDKLYPKLVEAQRDYDLTPAGVEETEALAERMLDEGRVDAFRALHKKAADDKAEFERLKTLVPASETKGSGQPLDLNTLTVDEKKALASQTDDAELLRTLATQQDGSVRAAVAANTATPPEVLATLAEDYDRTGRAARVAVAGNPSTPVDALVSLTDDVMNEDTLTALAENPSSTAEVLTPLLDDDQYEDVRAVAAAHPNAPSEALAAAAASGNEFIRRAVASNPAVNHSSEALTILVADTDPRVREALEERRAELIAELKASGQVDDETAASLPIVWLAKTAASN